MTRIENSKPKLYALLVGINSYEDTVLLGNNKVRFPELYGCVSDANKIRDYLTTEIFFEPSIEMLTDQAATKQEVVRLFKEHLGKAGKDDTVLFYFSGHGTQEWAARSTFQSESDGRLEDIACYYKNKEDDFLLADKELRWLIYELSLKGSHIVTIFDCCHSGDNTRNGQLLLKSFGHVIEKRVPYVFPERNFDKFIFSEKIKQEEIKSSGEYTILPEGKHFHFSACESDESAVEISGEAVFTKVLLHVLNTTGGNITYHNLGKRVRQYMRNVFEQKPKIYVPNAEPNDMFRNFLNKPFDENSSAFGEVIYNQSSGWQLNLGAIHGIGKNTPPFKVFDAENSSKTFTATIGSVNIESADVIINGDLDQEKAYKANIEGLSAEAVRVHFASNTAELSDQSKIFDQLLKESKQFIIPEDDEQQAQYVLRFLNGKYYITFPGDVYRPLVKPVLAVDKEVASKISSDLRHITNWEFLKNLINKDPVNLISEDALKIEISSGDVPGSSEKVSDGRSIDINYISKDGRWGNTIRVKLINDSPKNLYCCVLYLISNFASYSRYLSPAVKMLGPGESVELKYKENSFISLGVDPVMKWYNWKEQKDYLKFIISTENFDANLLDFPGLNPPDIPIDNRHADNPYAEETPFSGNTKGWFTKQVELVFKNPAYNNITSEDLNAMLKKPETADFGLGLYFDVSDDHFDPVYKLKDGLQVNNQKGFIGEKIIDIANWWSRRRRNQFYNQAILRFPDRIKIVSEGDSWFQHPLVMDIIDHLHRIYNIYCVAAAGDTLRNYFSREKSNGEYFIDALDEKKPSFFLISGGGNDILGAQFRNYIINDGQDHIVEGENPERFLKNELFKEIDSLVEIYKTIFIHLQTHKPGLRVIVHGYDYPVKLNDEKKGWLGKYMIQKGINKPGDRKAIIHLIMDTFNQKLYESCKDLDNVTYIDLRKMVRFDENDGVDQWYDEIHPNNDGFQQIAMKYIQIIDKIISEQTLVNGSKNIITKNKILNNDNH